MAATGFTGCSGSGTARQEKDDGQPDPDVTGPRADSGEKTDTGNGGAETTVGNGDAENGRRQ
ncbi:hypothetical protein ACLI4Q_12545 [Natrialbaceae archaeon A-CW1-1]